MKFSESLYRAFEGTFMLAVDSVSTKKSFLSIFHIVICSTRDIEKDLAVFWFRFSLYIVISDCDVITILVALRLFLVPFPAFFTRETSAFIHVRISLESLDCFYSAHLMCHGTFPYIIKPVYFRCLSGG